MNIRSTICFKKLSLLSALAGGAALMLAAPAAQALPAALRPVFYQALARDAGAVYRINKDGCAVLPKQALKACFDAHGAHFTGAATPLSLHLAAWGRGKGLTEVTSVRPAIKGNRVSYRHGSLTAWWRVLPVGFEQGFTIAKRPAGHGELTLALATSRQDAGAPPIRHSRESGNPSEGRPSTSLRYAQGKRGDEGTLTWGKLRYGKLVVTDANGKVIPATLTTQGDRILIAVYDAHAAYPLTVDPLVWIEQKVVASDGAADDQFGYSIALDGTTALVGARYANGNGNQGAAYVFTKSAGSWSQTAKLTASDGAAGAQFGWSVALVGTTALVGAPYFGDSQEQGAAYVFSSSDGSWIQTQKLTASDGAANDWFGYSIALDGTTALVGAACATYNPETQFCGPGAAYVFSNSDGSWTQTAKITASDGAGGDVFGWSVALNGTTALVGAAGADVDGQTNQGAAYVFNESNGAWTQTTKLIASDGVNHDEFGYSVAVYGVTALVGAPGATVNGNGQQGAAYVFDGNNSWDESAEIFADDGAAGDTFGTSIALDGTTALIGANSATVNGNYAQGAAYVFNELGGTWTQKRKLTSSDGAAIDQFGVSVALDGTTALIGALDAAVNGNMEQGAAYFYQKTDFTLIEQAPRYVNWLLPYLAQTFVTNNGDTTSAPVILIMLIPTAASFISAIPTQGECEQIAGAPFVRCELGSIAGNAGEATVNMTLKPRDAGLLIENTVSIANARPPLTASAPTIVTVTGCPDGYTVYTGHLDAGEAFTSEPISVTEASQKYVDLMSPASFAFFAIVTTRYGTHTYVYPHAKHGHRWGAAGTYQVGVQAGATGGDYTLCVKLNL